MFSKVLRQLRIEHNLSQLELGQELNLAQRTISHYENGSRFPDELVLNLIANYFNVSMDYLFGRTSLKNYNIKYIRKSN